LRSRFPPNDADVVLAAIVVLTGQFLGQAIEFETIEGLAFGQADFLQALHQVFGLEVLVAGDFDLRDRRALAQFHDQDVALSRQFDIVEKSGLEQRTHGRRGPIAVDAIAFFNGQCAEHGAGRNAGEAFQPDVRHHEGIEGGGILRAQRSNQDQRSNTFHHHSVNDHCGAMAQQRCPGLVWLGRVGRRPAHMLGARRAE
jgi:hypothetical protein